VSRRLSAGAPARKPWNPTPAALPRYALRDALPGRWILLVRPNRGAGRSSRDWTIGTEGSNSSRSAKESLRTDNELLLIVTLGAIARCRGLGQIRFRTLGPYDNQRMKLPSSCESSSSRFLVAVRLVLEVGMKLSRGSAYFFPVPQMHGPRHR